MNYNLIPGKPVLVIGQGATFKSTIAILIFVDYILKEDKDTPKTILILGFESKQFVDHVLERWLNVNADEWLECNNVKIHSFSSEDPNRFKTIDSIISKPGKHYAYVDGPWFYFSDRDTKLITKNEAIRQTIAVASKLARDLTGFSITCIHESKYSINMSSGPYAPGIRIQNDSRDYELKSIAGVQLYTPEKSTIPRATIYDGNFEDIGKQLEWKQQNEH